MLSAPPKTVLVSACCLFLSALVAVSYPKLPARDAVGATPLPTSCNATNAVCAGRTWETLVCDSSIKLTKCFDVKLTCHSWNVCDCCSAVPLHKCLSPLAGRAFGPDCSSPIDAREEVCSCLWSRYCVLSSRSPCPLPANPVPAVLRRRLHALARLPRPR